MLSFKYITSKGVEYDLLTMENTITECDAFDYAFVPVEFKKKYGSRIFGFEMNPKEFEATFYIFGENRKEYINELIAAFDYDVMNLDAGTIVCNGYSIPAFSISSSDNSNNTSDVLWDTLKRKFYCPYPLWSKETSFNLFADTAEPTVFEDIKDYLPVSENGKADYEWDYMTHSGKNGSFNNTDLTGSEFVLVINGYAEDPVIHINDAVIALDVTILDNEYLTIDSRSKTVIKTRANGTTENCYGNRDVSVDIFKKIPKGTVNVWWNNDFTWTLATYDERTAPLWN